MKSTIFSVAALAAVSSAAPTKRAAAINDADILNYALTLEHLEDTFYRQALEKFSVQDFKDAGFHEKLYHRIETVAGDERTHVAFLTEALTKAGYPATAECTYDFGYKDVAGFLATASVLEGVGVSAYLGAAASIMEKAYLTAAGSILTTEARHSAYIRNAIKQEPFAQPFDNPLDFNEVYTLASPFIKSCPPSNPPLPVMAFPALTATAQGGAALYAGCGVDLSTKANITGDVYAAFITVTGPIFVDVEDNHGAYSVQVPAGIAGQSYLVLTKSNGTVTDENVIAGPAIVEIAGTAASS